MVKYPQYRIGVRWTYDKDGERESNSTSLDCMYREDPGAEEVERWTREEWWPTYEKKGDDSDDLVIAVEYRGEESWCLVWFNHWTFDVGQSDEECLASFEDYVRRYEHMQDYWPGDPPEGYRCLMGAEDRWRWHGGSDADDRTEAPCRCKHCREQGVIRVNH